VPSWIEFNNCPTRCDLFSLLHFCRQLYMFRVLTPIIRSSYSCNYSFWYSLTGSTTIRFHCWVHSVLCCIATKHRMHIHRRALSTTWHYTTWHAATTPNLYNEINVTISSDTLARNIQLPDDGLRTETCRSVFNVLMCKFYKFYTCAVVGVIIEFNSKWFILTNCNSAQNFACLSQVQLCLRFCM